jgi:spermidine synthase
MALKALPDGPRRIGVVGLGTGTLAAWGRAGDSIRFYEINPIVPKIATTFFSFLPDSKARTEIVLGDARIQLARELAEGHSHDFDLIAVDAFSSDAIPVHLLTAECADLYRSRLAPGGMLLLHISNRTLDLEPVARGLARYLNWSAAQIISENDRQTGEDASTWVVLTDSLIQLQGAILSAKTVGWVHPEHSPILWTDDFSSLWHVLKF